MHRNQVNRDEVIVSMEHDAGKIFYGFGSEVKIPKHFIRAPPIKQLDNVGVNIGSQEGHGPNCKGGANRKVSA